MRSETPPHRAPGPRASWPSRAPPAMSAISSARSGTARPAAWPAAPRRGRCRRRRSGDGMREAGLRRRAPRPLRGAAGSALSPTAVGRAARRRDRISRCFSRRAPRRSLLGSPASPGRAVLRNDHRAVDQPGCRCRARGPIVARPARRRSAQPAGFARDARSCSRRAAASRNRNLSICRNRAARNITGRAKQARESPQRACRLRHRTWLGRGAARPGRRRSCLAVLLALIVAGLALSPFWAPAMAPLFPWGASHRPRPRSMRPSPREWLRSRDGRHLRSRTSTRSNRSWRRWPAVWTGSVSAVDARLTEIEKRPAPPQVDLEAVKSADSALAQRIAAVETAAGETKAALQQLGQRLDGIEAQSSPHTGNRSRS